MAITIRRKPQFTPPPDSPSPEVVEVEGEAKPTASSIVPVLGSLTEQIKSLSSSEPTSEFIPLVGPSKWLQEECEKNSEYRARYEKLLRDIATCKTIKAHKEAGYASEVKAHDHQKNRAKTLDPRLHDRRNWFIHMGPRPHDDWSVDRINPKKGYLVGNMRWASPKTQTENRRKTKWYTLPDGTQITVSGLARYLGMKYDTVRKALDRAKDPAKKVQELIDRHGPRIGAEHAWNIPPTLHHLLEPIYKDKHGAGQSRLAWFCSFLPKMLRELEGDKASHGKMNVLSSLLQEAEAELNEIRQQQWRGKHALAYALLDAVSPPSKPLSDLNPFSPTKTAAEPPQHFTKSSEVRATVDDDDEDEDEDDQPVTLEFLWQQKFKDSKSVPSPAIN